MKIRCTPTYHPAAVLRQWEWRKIAVHDLRRAKRELQAYTPPPTYDFILKPEFLPTIDLLEGLELWATARHTPLWLDFDIETVIGHIRCFAITWSETEGICIPLMAHGMGGCYWTAEEEGKILYLVSRLLTHPNVLVRGQNLLYDFQYTWRHWHFIPNLGQDSMISHHCLWAGLPKSLAFQASIYSPFYVYWKEMGRESGKAGE